MRAISGLKQWKKSRWNKQMYLNIKYLQPVEEIQEQTKKQQTRKIFFFNITTGKCSYFFQFNFAF